MLRFLAITVVTALIVFFYTLLSLDEVSKSKIGNQRGGDQPASTLSAVGRENNGGSNNTVEYDIATKLSEIAIKFLTDVKITDVLLAFFTYFLWRSTAGLDDSTRKLWDVSLKADRPWMTSQGLEIGTFKGIYKDDSGERNIIFGFRFCAIWQNVGKSPAISESYFDFRIVPFYQELIPTFTRQPPDSIQRKMMTGPGISVKSVTKALDDIEHQAFRARKIKVAVYARISYAGPEHYGPSYHTELCGFVIFEAEYKDDRGVTRLHCPFTARGEQNTFS